MDIDWLAQQFTQLTEVKFLAAGGQKEVFVAKNSSGENVALKIFNVRATQDRIEREIRVVTRLRSVNIPRIHEFGEIDTVFGRLAWVIEDFIEGTTLSDKIASSRLNIDEAIYIMESVLNVLEDANENHIVHRDIKPDNIIVDTNNKIWLLDFGIARHLDMVSLTATDIALGASTPGYAPIEQFKNQKDLIDFRSDLFALGVTIYECLTGENPYRKDADNFLHVLNRVETGRLDKLSLNGSNGDFEDLIFALTQPDREHRPISIQEVRDWLNDVKQGRG